MSVIDLDYETASEIDLVKQGLDVYSAHPSTRVIKASWSLDRAPVRLWSVEEGSLPAEFRDALADPHVEKRAFQAQFERKITERVLKSATPIGSWRCTQARAYMHSFFGGLEEVGEQVELAPDRQKMRVGDRLIRQFCGPQKITKNQPHLWRDWRTDPDDWNLFGEYCGQDTVAEQGIWDRVARFPIGPDEWAIYELDQIINDRGLPMDMQFCRHAAAFAVRRKAELKTEMQGYTGLDNPNSRDQLLPWLQARGYPFDDLKKDTIKKVLNEVEAGLYQVDDICWLVLQKRQIAARMSVQKFNAINTAVGEGDRLRYAFQYAGATRTLRFAGRRVQTQNLPRTPKELTEGRLLEIATDFIRDGKYEALNTNVMDPMLALVGCVRSAIRAPKNHNLVVSDLASIETVGQAWLSGNQKLLDDFVAGRDPYKVFGAEWLRCPYEEVTGEKRQKSKPPVLGCAYGISGGELRDGKKTGLWGYSEGMDVDMTQQEAVSAVLVWRRTNAPTVATWGKLADGFAAACQGHNNEVGFIRFENRKPFVIMWLPGGNPRYYYKPMVTYETIVRDDGSSWQRRQLSYLGKSTTNNWVRIYTHGGKILENATQGFCRDLLAKGLLRAHRAGFYLVGHCHDEGIAVQKAGDNYYTHDRLSEILTEPFPEYPGLPLRAAGYAAQFYRKD